MATKSATSMTKSSVAIKTFVTFRVAGDTLDPLDVTALFKMKPTHQHRKGQEYSTGKSKVLPKTGVWFFSTETESTSRNIYVHIKILLSYVFGDSRLDGGIRILKLRDLLEQKQLTATMTFFWYGKANASYPSIPDELIDLLKLVPVQIEYDFDRDEDLHPQRLKAA